MSSTTSVAGFWFIHISFVQFGLVASHLRTEDVPSAIM